MVKIIKKIKKFCIKLFKLIKKDILSKKKWGIALIIVSIFIGMYLNLSAGLLWFLFLIFALYGWESRIICVMALLCLATCPFLLHFKKDILAEQVAVYAFFFLVMTVVLQIIEYKRHPKIYKDDKNKER
jgi:hypothetical protein